MPSRKSSPLNDESEAPREDNTARVSTARDNDGNAASRSRRPFPPINASYGSGTLTLTFPQRLRKMLDQAEAESYDHIINWTPDGSTFAIRDRQALESEVLGRYFETVRYRSFAKNLNLYGFSKLSNRHRTEKLEYQHSKFHRDHPDLHSQVRRAKVRPTNEPAEGTASLPAQDATTSSTPTLSQAIMPQLFFDSSGFDTGRLPSLQQQQPSRMLDGGFPSSSQNLLPVQIGASLQALSPGISLVEQQQRQWNAPTNSNFVTEERADLAFQARYINVGRLVQATPSDLLEDFLWLFQQDDPI